MKRVYREEMDGRLSRKGRGTWREDRRRKGGERVAEAKHKLSGRFKCRKAAVALAGR